MNEEPPGEEPEEQPGEQRDPRPERPTGWARPKKRRRISWVRRDAVNLGEAAVQFFAVLAGVLVAFALTNWSTQNHQQAMAHKAMQAIRAELVANRTELRENAAAWYAVAKTMMAAPENHNPPARRPCYKWEGWGGYGGANITDAAYQTAIATQALAHMPFKQAHTVALVYSRQDAYHSARRFIGKHFVFGGAQPLATCVTGVILFGRHDRILARAYTPLLGPITAEWPPQPPIPGRQPRKPGQNPQ